MHLSDLLARATVTEERKPIGRQIGSLRDDVANSLKHCHEKAVQGFVGREIQQAPYRPFRDNQNVSFVNRTRMVEAKHQLRLKYSMNRQERREPREYKTYRCVAQACLGELEQ
jgi:hypothetical protein